MKRVWKCNYCSEIDADKEVIAPHEKECYFNPKNKKCITCEDHIRASNSVSGSDECADGISTEDVFDMQEDDITCDKWKKKG